MGRHLPLPPILFIPRHGALKAREALEVARSVEIMRNDKISPFRVDVAADVLSDLRGRLQNTRWSYQVEGTKWDAGTDQNYLRELVAYWQDG